jgi:hypothetical protein
MAEPSIAFRLVKRVHVAVHGATPCSDAEWLGYLEHIGARLEAVDAIYSFTLGGGPDTNQRKSAVSFWSTQPKRPPIAVVTPSMLVVRMAGALRWFMPTQIKAFLPRDIEAAFDYLGLDAEQRSATRRTVDALLPQLPRE